RSTFPAPATSHAACGFPALRAPICFMPRLMGPILLGRLSALPNPSFPAEALLLLACKRINPETPEQFGLHLDVYSPPQVLQIGGRLCHLVLASLTSETLQMAGPLRSTDVTPLHRYCGPSRHPLVFGRLPGFAGYTAYPALAISRRDEEGFSSCSACPCHRAVASTPPR